MSKSVYRVYVTNVTNVTNVQTNQNLSIFNFCKNENEFSVDRRLYLISFLLQNQSCDDHSWHVTLCYVIKTMQVLVFKFNYSFHFLFPLLVDTRFSIRIFHVMLCYLCDFTRFLTWRLSVRNIKISKNLPLSNIC